MIYCGPRQFNVIQNILIPIYTQLVCRKELKKLNMAISIRKFSEPEMLEDEIYAFQIRYGI